MHIEIERLRELNADLLAALKAVERDGLIAAKQVRAAIAKADGKQP